MVSSGDTEANKGYRVEICHRRDVGGVCYHSFISSSGAGEGSESYGVLELRERIASGEIIGYVHTGKYHFEQVLA
jgi:hypothetical protein